MVLASWGDSYGQPSWIKVTAPSSVSGTSFTVTVTIKPVYYDSSAGKSSTAPPFHGDSARLWYKHDKTTVWSSSLLTDTDTGYAFAGSKTLSAPATAQYVSYWVAGYLNEVSTSYVTKPVDQINAAPDTGHYLYTGVNGFRAPSPQ